MKGERDDVSQPMTSESGMEALVRGFMGRLDNFNLMLQIKIQGASYVKLYQLAAQRILTVCGPRSQDNLSGDLPPAYLPAS